MGEQLKSGWEFGCLRALEKGSWEFRPSQPKEETVTNLQLTAEQEAEAQRLADRIVQKTKEEVLGMARLLVSKADHEVLGATEFAIRDRVHRIGAFALEAALNERKKRGTKGRARAVRTVPRRRGSSNTGASSW